MIAFIENLPVNPAKRAEIINARARTEMALPLWQAAIGEQVDKSVDPAGTSLTSLLAGHARAVMSGDQVDTLSQRALASIDEIAAQVPLPPPDVTPPIADLGANAKFGAALSAAAERTGIPAAALATIVDAEAAKGVDGQWKTMSRNPNSSAAGLGQFLNRTWIDEAERDGTWLNGIARERGWLTESGHVAKSARAELLALRYDGDTSIHAIADYATANLNYLKKRGIETEDTVSGIAQNAYLAHHLGAGDAVRFLTGGLSPSRAQTLLVAQVGSAAAGQRIAHAADASDAHRTWLMEYVGRHVRPDRFYA